MSIKLFLSDIDGCLTDGGYFVSTQSSGGYFRKFNTKDFMGVELLHNAGIQIGFVTTSAEPCFAQFARAANYAKILMGCRDKLARVRTNFINSGKYKWSEIAYFGDDLNDLSLLAAVGYPGCPANAATEVKELVKSKDDGFISTLKGGEGCVREYIDTIRYWENITELWRVKEPV